MLDYAPPRDRDDSPELSTSDAAVVFSLVSEARAHLAATRILDASIACFKALEVAPNYPTALHLAGIASSRLGQLTQAADLIRRAIAFRHSTAAFHNNLGDVLTALAQYDDAERCFTTAIDLDVNHAIAWFNLGAIRARAGDNEGAARCRARASELGLAAAA